MNIQENLQPFELELEKSRIRDVLDIANKIEYGFISKIDGKKITDRDFIHNCDLNKYYALNIDPLVTLKNKLGICQDQAIAIKYLMNLMHPDDSVYLYAITKEPIGHCVPCYCHENKWYYIENSWDKEKGLHGYFDSKDELEKYLKFVYSENHASDTPKKSKVKLFDYENGKVNQQINEDTRHESVKKFSPSDKFKYVINFKDNTALATEIESIIENVKLPTYCKMIRDNCGMINAEIRQSLEKAGYNVKTIQGFFIVDNVALVDAQDLKTLNAYEAWRKSNLSKQDFIVKNNYLGKTKWWFLSIPHTWLEADGLIVDRAWPMFWQALETPVSKNNYSYTDLYKPDLNEDTRGQLIAKSRNADLYKNKAFGKNRFERKKLSKIANQVKSYNSIDMNKLFKQDLLEFVVPVIGETGTYEVTVQFNNVISELAKNIKNNQNKFEFKVVLQALTKIFNINNIKIKCTCDDWKYRYAHNMIVNNNSVDGSDKDPGPGKTGITASMKGQGCKHALLVLNNQDWAMKLASTIKNYITYMDAHKHELFLKAIFPKLYGTTSDEASAVNLVGEDTNLDIEKSAIDAINDWAKNRGKYQKGSNVNPVQADKLEKEQQNDQK